MKRAIRIRPENKKRRWLQTFTLIFAAIAAILFFTALIIDFDWNRKSHLAGERSEAVLAALDELSAQIKDPKTQLTEEINIEEETETAGEAGGSADDRTGDSKQEGEALYDQIPDEMPGVVIDEVTYMGTLIIPSLSLRLPVITLDYWQPEYMDIAPTVYDGSLKTHDLIIMAHNYQTHFLGILGMQPGQEVILKTVDGYIYTYTVSYVETFHRSQKEKLYEGDWDLTLFTCVPQTYNRCTVRCRLNKVTSLKDL